MTKKEEKSNWERDDNDDPDDNDRKPPAKEVVVMKHRRRQKQQDGSSSSPRSTEDTAEASIVSSNASCSASTSGDVAADGAADAAAHSPALSSPSTPATATAASPVACMPPSSVMTHSTSTPNMNKQQQMASHLAQIDQSGCANIINDDTVVMNIVRLVQSSSQQQQVAIVLLSTTVLSVTAFICCILPMTALVAMALGTASFGLLLQQAFQYIVQEFNFRVEHGRGLSELLQHLFGGMVPLENSLLQTLTRTTLHEYLTDNSFAVEYRYLLLYFIPGISPEQLQAYIDRLDPRHRELLRRPGGIGQLLLGPTGMRALIGQRQWELLQQQGQQQQTPPLLQQQSQQQQPPLVQLLEMQDRQAMETATPARTLFHRDIDNNDSRSSSSCSDLGLDVTVNDLSGGLSESQATRMARQLGLMTTPTAAAAAAPNDATTVAATAVAAATVVVVPTSTTATVEEQQERAILLLHQQEEEAVVTEAFWSSYNYFYDMALGAVRGAIVPSRRTVVRSSIIGIGIFGISVPTVAAGVWNFWTSGSSSTMSFVSRFWLSRRSDSDNNNRRSDLWPTVLLGSGVAGVVLYATTTAYSRSSSTSTTKPDEKKKKNGNNGQSK